MYRPARCLPPPKEASSYYARGTSRENPRPGGPVDPKTGMALLLAAKLASREVSIEYANDGPRADFWGYGISSCEIRRPVLH